MIQSQLRFDSLGRAAVSRIQHQNISDSFQLDRTDLAENYWDARSEIDRTTRAITGREDVGVR